MGREISLSSSPSLPSPSLASCLSIRVCVRNPRPQFCQASPLYPVGVAEWLEDFGTVRDRPTLTASTSSEKSDVCHTRRMLMQKLSHWAE